MTDDDHAENPWAAPPHLRGGRIWAAGQAVRTPSIQKRKGPLKTYGMPRPGSKPFVYVATSNIGTKIGFTTNKKARERSLQAKIVFAIPVVWNAATEVERVALQLLGRDDLSRGEWVCANVESAADAVRQAALVVSRYKHVDPDITEDDARRRRIALARHTEVC